MPQKPFREKNPARKPRAAADNPDKSEFEDKVHQEFEQFLDRFKQLEDKLLNPKVEKDEVAEKYGKDYKDIGDKQHKLEKLEKERKDIIKEGEVGVFQPPSFGSDPRIEQRIAALEDIVGRLVHFIPAKSRPDLRKGALKQEPETAKRKE